MPPRKTWLWFVLILLANYLLMRLLMPSADAPVTVPYTLFKEEVKKGNVKAIFSRGETIKGRFAAPVTYPPAGEQRAAPAGESQTATTFTTTLPAFVDPGLEAFLIEHGVEISAKPIQTGGNLWVTFLFGFGPALLLILFYVWMFRRAQQGGGLGGGLMGIGKSRARRYDQAQETKVTFDDVAGIDEAENELVEIVDFLKDPPKYTRLGGTAPKGVLLVGAPGTGKTLWPRQSRARQECRSSR
jgi:cell division protease FtsH